jgi:subtilisin
MLKFTTSLGVILLGAALLAGALAPRGAGADARTYVVVLKSGTDAEGVVRAHDRLQGTTMLHTYSHALDGYAATLAPRAVKAIRRDPRVADVVVDRPLRLEAQTEPTGVRRIRARPAPRESARAAVSVAVIDTGIDLDHPDLRVVPGRNCIAPAALPDDDSGHGTHVAGTIGARDDRNGVVGVAPGVKLVAVKAFDASGRGSFATALCAIDWVTANAAVVRVANLSFGYTGRVSSSNPDCSNRNADPLHTAICRSVLAGVTYVASMGNEAEDGARHLPSAYEEVIAVSGLADSDGSPGGKGGPPSCLPAEVDDTFLDFSNWGDTVELAAPGACLLSTTKNGGYAVMSGTSMAAAHVSGAAARFLETHPLARPGEVRAALLAAAEAGPIPGDPDGFPEGIVRVSRATEPPALPVKPPAIPTPTIPVPEIPGPEPPGLPVLPPLPGVSGR